MTYTQPICYDCKHFNQETGACAAFPKGVPDIIFLGDNDHSKPLKNQGNDIVFEKKEDGNAE